MTGIANRLRSSEAKRPSSRCEARAPASVLFIGGSQRSGSTLLDRLLGQVPGHVSAGEVVHLWTRGVRDDELCGCGVPFGRCPFWSEVGRVAFGGWDRIDVDDIVSLQRSVDRNRYIIFMLFPFLAPRYARRLRSYERTLSKLFRAIAVGGGGVVVDSSKHISTAFLLRRVPGLRVRVVHLVRDSRGVAFSLGKRVRRPEVREAEAFMHRRSPWRAALEWSVFNGLFHVLRWAGTPVARVRYEDLISEPAGTIGRFGARPGGPSPEPTFIDGRTVTLDVGHTVAGNPMRFSQGRTELRLDEAWRMEMRRWERWTTTALTAPLLITYGYRLGRS